MVNTAANPWHELIGEAFSLKFDAFHRIASIPNGLWLSLFVVLLAGLSLAIAQSIILFVSRVRPGRFAFSLVLNAILFTVGFLFLTLSTWIICLLPGSPHVSFLTLIKVLGLGYAPLLFSFLGALPYLGYPIGNLLSVWNLLAMVVGFAVIAQVSAGSAFIHVGLGWLVKQVVENTIGQPIAHLGHRIADRVAGVALADTRQELSELLLAGFRPAAPRRIVARPPNLEVRQRIQNTRRSVPDAARAVTSIMDPAIAVPSHLKQQIGSNRLVQLKHYLRSIAPHLKLALSLWVMAIAFVMILIVLRPIRNGLFGWYLDLHGFWRLTFDLIWISVVAIVFAGILAPLESLGWWAGWYGDELDTFQSAERRTAEKNGVDRYVVYLDGIAQSGDEYTPDIEVFLAALKPTLPKGVELVQGLMMYSVLNKPLDEDRPLAFLWRMADKMRWTNPAAVLGLLVNVRNMIIVAVSSDQRYGPIYNQGIAQVILDGLLDRGYRLRSGIPITLIGYSGGGEMSVAAAPYLKRSTSAPIEVISLGGVMSANHNILKLEQLYHIVGDRDSVERAGPVMFPGRWKIFPLSYWNRAKRKGKITILSAGAVAHQVPGGYMDPQATLPDGRTHLQQTIGMIGQILRGEAVWANQSIPKQTSHYARYQTAAFNRPDYYPIHQAVDSIYYRPISDWMGRLILPKLEARSQVRGALFEIHHAPDAYRFLIGKTVKLRWSNDPEVQRMIRAVTKDVHFSADAEFSSRYGGVVHPDRLNHWRQVDPLESLAGSHPVDDLIVRLNSPIQVTEDALYITSTPTQITGRFYALVRFVQPLTGTDRFQVIHFDRTSRKFNGKTDVMRLPPVMLAKSYGSYPSATRGLEKSPFNETGWYVYGAKDAEGVFVGQAIAPRALFQLHPETVLFGGKAAFNYIRHRAWAKTGEQKGKISSVLCAARSNDSSDEIAAAIAEWQVGDRALVLHTYGGIGGKHKEPAAATPIFFGHFAYGIANVIHEPLADEPRFDICYHQVYTHNIDGLIAGTLHWSRFMGDRQLGWVGTRPTCDILIKLDAYTDPYKFSSGSFSPLNLMARQLEVMTARYRIGDGTGGTYVGPANNCAQDSNQALFASIRAIAHSLGENPQVLEILFEDETQAQRFKTLQALGKDLERVMQPLGLPRADWENHEYNLGSTLEDEPLRNLWTGIGSWRTMFPRKASDAIARTFLKYGASVWVLRTNQIGGYDPDIEPIAPTTF
jgi:predicted Abi (CAAX) family protease